MSSALGSVSLFFTTPPVLESKIKERECNGFGAALPSRNFPKLYTQRIWSALLSFFKLYHEI